jgi:hypothetical protein
VVVSVVDLMPAAWTLVLVGMILALVAASVAASTTPGLTPTPNSVA